LHPPLITIAPPIFFPNPVYIDHSLYVNHPEVEFAFYMIGTRWCAAEHFDPKGTHRAA
jgi:hypothetical protein